MSCWPATFRKVFFDDASVTVREVDDLHLGTRGKFNEYLNLWAGPQGPTGGAGETS